ncbi:DUF5330 domain-containing protein [Nitratireductor sp. L1-7-SE]|uniref:DUF5330 domain-containing protein n=1 Tax=Nitratireductor rhodophyticola TaxID=2854036 RepID=A0ABS7RAW2_9HYPH|nr:DUF5330 domain-containing protein [Nitratireductor rhodophyticola]MBY8918086.1 DUF5330 domain-containing protein [Nitratireductor rhodophyticola]MBY8921105.1 DUF5330 domain-containing protein [Nitratireductor rhodophyticola]
MGFLIRSIFWLSLVLLLLPIGGTGSEDGTETPQVGALQALGAAREAISDMVGICERKPEVCATGRAALQTIGARARESARFAYEMLEEPAEGSAEATAGITDVPLTTGSVAEHPAGHDQ